MNYTDMPLEATSLAWSGSGDWPLLGCQLLTISMHLHWAGRAEAYRFCLYTGTNFLRAAFLWANHLLKALPPSTTILELKISTYNLMGEPEAWSMAKSPVTVYWDRLLTFKAGIPLWPSLTALKRHKQNCIQSTYQRSQPRGNTQDRNQDLACS